MTFDLARISDPEFVAEGRMAPHSDHRWFASAAEAASGSSGFEQSLNGLWKFHHADDPTLVPTGFEQPGFDVTGWEDIPVPAHVQLHGHDRPQYVNVQYPWDGVQELEPGQVPTGWNPVACYVRDVELDVPPTSGERVSVTFHGAESAIALWCNGRYVGWATDSFTPSEFDLTQHLVEGSNRLAAQVFKWTAASWLEDQDFFRFHGLFRDVVLRRRPVVHAEDVEVRTELASDFSSATIAITVDLVGAGSVSAEIAGVGSMELLDGRLVAHLDAPRLWSNEDPYLYAVTISVFDEAGTLTEVIPQTVGLRTVAITDAVFTVNGQRVVFHGVNRHEFGPRGRVLTADEIEADVRLIKQSGANAVRTSHYPNSSVFYDLCDRHGLFVIDEMNLETHAMWAKVVEGRLSIEEALPGDRPEWRAALADRAANMLERDKNHPSVIIWSLGNESFGGSLLADVSDWFRDRDGTRPVHYEGVSWDPRYPHTTDITSEMYIPAAEVEAYLAEHRDKPYLLCEYAHAMGNSFGAVDKYLELADREPLFAGGFIWDFVDQTLPTTDRHGRVYAGYGGDFGDRPTDYEFSANGIVFADRTPTPAFQEVRYLYQSFRTRITAEDVTIENRRLFTAMDDVEVSVRLASEGRELHSATLIVDLEAGESVRLPLPFGVPDTPGEYTLDVRYELREATSWAPAGYAVGWEQEVLVVGDHQVAVTPTPGPVEVARTPALEVEVAPAPRVVEDTHNIGVHGDGFSVLFSRLFGHLASYQFGRDARGGGRELLRDLPYPNFWHAPTSNERGWGMPFADGQWLLASKARRPRPGFETPQVIRHEHAVEVVYGYELPTAPISEVDVSYLVDGAGRVDVTMTLRPGEGLGDPPEFGMTLAVDADLHRLRWYGEGPAECYVDRRRGARLDVWQGEVAEQLTPYMRPQESGNHTGVRWAEVVGDDGWGVRVAGDPIMEFSALPWTPFEIDNARHHVDLPPIQNTVLRPALARRGVGGDNSWGARTHPEYLLPTGELTFRFSFQGVQRGWATPGGAA